MQPNRRLSIIEEDINVDGDVYIEFPLPMMIQGGKLCLFYWYFTLSPPSLNLGLGFRR